MNELSLFPEMPPPSEEQRVTSVFLAILPDPVAAEQIARCAREVKASHALKGTPRPVGRFHITLQSFDHSPRALERSVQMAQMVASKVVRALPPFEVRFDQVKSFANKKSNCPCVLTDHGGNEALRTLAAKLQHEAGSTDTRYTPHVTLLYDDEIVKQEAVEPVCWMVKEIVLLKAVMKSRTFDELGRWGLQG